MTVLLWPTAIVNGVVTSTEYASGTLIPLTFTSALPVLLMENVLEELSSTLTSPKARLEGSTEIVICGLLTVTTHLAVNPPSEVVISTLAVPAPFATMLLPLSMSTTLVLSEVTVYVLSVASEGDTVTERALLSPISMDKLAGETLTPVTGTVLLFTVTVALEDTPPSLAVTVKEPSGGEVAVTGISLNQSSAELEVGKTLQLKSTITPSNATNKSVQWTSSNSAVASVDINGLVTAKAIGTAQITAKTEDGGKTATVSITVKKASEQNVPVTGVSINMSSLSLKVGESATLTTTIAPANATNKGVTWTTSMSSRREDSDLQCYGDLYPGSRRRGQRDTGNHFTYVSEHDRR